MIFTFDTQPITLG